MVMESQLYSSEKMMVHYTIRITETLLVMERYSQNKLIVLEAHSLSKVCKLQGQLLELILDQLLVQIWEQVMDHQFRPTLDMLQAILMINRLQALELL